MKQIAAWSLVLMLVGGCARTTFEGSDNETIASGFGANFLEEPLPWKRIDKPVDDLGFKAGTYEFKQLKPDEGKRYEAELKRDGDRWRFDLGTGTVLICRIEDDGSVLVESSEDLEHKVLSRYDPPEPLLMTGARPGDTKTVEIDVSVHPMSDPSRVRYTGHLTLVYRVLGRWRVTVPSGTYDTVAFTWDYQGKVGPANVHEVAYWFMAPDVGPVAILKREDVKAMLVYTDRTDRTSVLVEHKPER